MCKSVGVFLGSQKSCMECCTLSNTINLAGKDFSWKLVPNRLLILYCLLELLWLLIARLNAGCCSMLFNRWALMSWFSRDHICLTSRLTVNERLSPIFLVRCFSNLSGQQACVKVVGMQITKYLLRLCIYSQLDIGKVSCIKRMNSYLGSAWSSWNNFSTLFTGIFFFRVLVLSRATWNPPAWWAEPLSSAFTWAIWDEALSESVNYAALGNFIPSYWYLLPKVRTVGFFVCLLGNTVTCCFWKWSFKKSCFNRSVQPFQVLNVCWVSQPNLFLFCFDSCVRWPLQGPYWHWLRCFGAIYIYIFKGLCSSKLSNFKSTFKYAFIRTLM